MVKRNAAEVASAIETKLIRQFGVTSREASAEQIYRAVVLTVKDILSEMRLNFKKKLKGTDTRRIAYLSMEFLTGPLLRSDLMNLGLTDAYREALSGMGVSLDCLAAEETDPALGSGGLGRLAAALLDSLTTQGYNATGYSICYEYGLFRQRIDEGDQLELPDRWMEKNGDLLSLRSDKTFTVRFGGNVREVWEEGQLHTVYEHFDTVEAVPCDIFVSGYDTEAVNLLRLWRAVSPDDPNMKLFSRGEYARAMEERASKEAVSKFLYPSDDRDEGKLLRLTQQYFLVSATCQSLVKEHTDTYGSPLTFARHNCIHINDTHPALAVPELMRIFMDDFGLGWEQAWGIVTDAVSYTNHTVMPEALEMWRCETVRLRLPRIYAIAEEINRRLTSDLWQSYPGDFERISRMSVLAYSYLRTANLCACAAHRINGVSRLHTSILKSSVFRDFYKWTPEKFRNITNGISHRRWVTLANPGLDSLLCSCIGDSWRREPARLADFSAFSADGAVCDRLMQIKRECKCRLSEEIFCMTGSRPDPDSVFDVQVKRIHEYKRQLLAALKIITLIGRITRGEEVQPATFIFGGKAAAGYYMAKSIIKLLWALGEEVRRTPELRQVISVVFLENYNVSLAERLIPAADISEQISLAGKEASGTGCMKFMINGALTLGTLDGANAEMEEAVGSDAIFLFGKSAAEVDALWREGYDSSRVLRDSVFARDALESLRRGFAGHFFDSIADYLHGASGISDPYMCLGELDPYISAYDRMCRTYRDPSLWYSLSVRNIAAAGYFSADRCVSEYARQIWDASPAT